MDGFERGPLRFDVRDGGPRDGEPVVLLHGFPQTSGSWDRVATRLQDAGYRTLAPDQRGYSPGARPPGRSRHRLPDLVGDVIALIRAAGGGPVHLAGHDWGAIVGWTLAAHRPDLVRTVTGVSVPHPGAYVGAALASRQALRSWYVLAFQVPVVPELLLGRPGAVERLLMGSGLPREDAARDAAVLAGHLRGPIDWYRGLPLSPRSMLRRHVTVPALQVWGDRDPFIARPAIERNALFMDAGYSLDVVEGGGHWLPDRSAERLAGTLLAHIGSAPPAG